jgi:uncharacterized protein YecE (DUF72 family)
VTSPARGSVRAARYSAERLDTAKVNSTFCRLPTLSTVERWRVLVPDDFRFVVREAA